MDARAAEKLGGWCGLRHPRVGQRTSGRKKAYRLCLGLLSLTREYPSERVNNNCRLANAEGLTRLKQIKSILKNNRDLVPTERDLHPSQELPQEHENIRGPRHFH